MNDVFINNLFNLFDVKQLSQTLPVDQCWEERRTLDSGKLGF